MKKQHLKLSETDKKYLTELLRKGQAKARVIRRAMALLLLHQGSTLQNVAKALGIDGNTVAIWRNRYLENGLDFLTDQPRSGRPTKFDETHRAKIRSLASSKTPEGHSKWSLQLLAKKAVELEFCESLSPTKVREMLKKRVK